jgi:hypothetical protein
VKLRMELVAWSGSYPADFWVLEGNDSEGSVVSGPSSWLLSTVERWTMNAKRLARQWKKEQQKEK